MKFWEAMKLVDEGKKVRRIMWDSKYFVMKLGNRVIVRPPDSNYEPYQSDMLCDGWEMVDSESTEHTPPSDIEEDLVYYTCPKCLYRNLWKPRP